MNFLQSYDAVASLPEVVLASLAMALLMYGVFKKGDANDHVTMGAIVSLALVAALVIFSSEGKVTAFGGAFIVDTFARVMKVMALFGSAIAIVLSTHFMKRVKMARFEYPILVMLASTGMMMMISANDLISLYVGLELQSLSLYVVAAIDRDSAKSSEAGLKYFVLGALVVRHAPLRRIPCLWLHRHNGIPANCRSTYGKLVQALASSSAWCSSSRASPSRSPPCRSICGRLMSMRVRQPRSLPSLPPLQRWRPWRCSSGS